MRNIIELQEIKVSYKPSFGIDYVRSPSDANYYAREMYRLGGCNLDLKEYSFAIYLNRANKIIGYHKLSEGGICGTVVDIRLAFSVGLKCLASGMVLVHNHPSGNNKPSKNDIQLTKKFEEAGKLIDIQLIDHLILTKDDYYSILGDGEGL